MPEPFSASPTGRALIRARDIRWEELLSLNATLDGANKHLRDLTASVENAQREVAAKAAICEAKRTEIHDLQDNYRKISGEMMAHYERN